MEESYGGGGGGGKTAKTEDDLQEEEVWAVISAREGSNSSNFEHGLSSSSNFAWRRHNAAAARGSAPPTRAARHHSSAPVDIPDWSKILRKRSKKNPWDDAENEGGGDDYGEGGAVKLIDGGDDGGDGEGEMAPPHEYLARRLERTRSASHSMCEGVGRTLKGRDLRKIRNSILSKTGFIE